MEKLFESTVLDELYQTRRNGFECLFIQKYGRQEEVEKVDSIYNELAKQIQNEITNQELILQLFENFEEAFIDKMCFWEEQYYKLGFSDAYNLKIEVQNQLEMFKMNIDQDSFTYYFDDFSNFFESYKCNNLYKRNDYIDIIKQINEQKDKYPKVRSFIEDGEFSNFSESEQEAILKIIKLEGSLEVLEIKEAFKLGLKEGRAF